MIKLLRIRNLATIEDLEIRFDEGFSILTGETGRLFKSLVKGKELTTQATARNSAMLYRESLPNASLRIGTEVLAVLSVLPASRRKI